MYNFLFIPFAEFDWWKSSLTFVISRFCVWILRATFCSYEDTFLDQSVGVKAFFSLSFALVLMVECLCRVIGQGEGRAKEAEREERPDTYVHPQEAVRSFLFI